MQTLTKEPEKKVEPRAGPWQVSLSRRNLGGPERAVRLIVGLCALIGAVGAASTATTVVLVIIALAGILTSAAAYCPITAALGLNTYRSRPK